ncbi:MAG: hypothetical protein MUE46_04110 [Xanthomonadales bacterium]|nr:hypothetical protein [Xanthomonadales bacterium]
MPVAFRLLLSVSLLALMACHESAPPPTVATPGLVPAPMPAAEARSPAPADAFLEALRGMCGKAFAGQVVTTDPADADFAQASLVMHVRECGEREVRVPFHVGEDRSRTWVFTRTEAGLRLKHDHRHADGTPDVLTMYGGDTVEVGSATQQAFPADQESKDLFEREGRVVSKDNVWVVTVEPGVRYVYELTRLNRHFRVEFDLTRPVETPPAPWGFESAP